MDSKTMAKELGLVDELGGIDKALDIAAERAETDAYTVIGYPAKESFFSVLLETRKSDYMDGQLKEILGEYYGSLKMLHHMKSADRIQARLPFELNIK